MPLCCEGGTLSAVYPKPLNCFSVCLNRSRLLHADCQRRNHHIHKLDESLRRTWSSLFPSGVSKSICTPEYDSATTDLCLLTSHMTHQICIHAHVCQSVCIRNGDHNVLSKLGHIHFHQYTIHRSLHREHSSSTFRLANFT